MRWIMIEKQNKTDKLPRIKRNKFFDKKLSDQNKAQDDINSGNVQNKFEIPACALVRKLLPAFVLPLMRKQRFTTRRECKKLVWRVLRESWNREGGFVYENIKYFDLSGYPRDLPRSTIAFAFAFYEIQISNRIVFHNPFTLWYKCTWISI